MVRKCCLLDEWFVSDDELQNSLFLCYNVNVNTHTLAGNAFKEFKNILQDYNAVINLSKMADEKDKLDCDTYIEKIGDKNYNGDFISKMYNDAEKAAMQKELDRLLDKQREEFCKNYYKYNSDGNIIGNNLEDWNNNGEEDKIDFYSKVYRSNNRDLWADADSNYEANNLEEKDLVSSIEKLQALKESCKGNSAAQEEIQKQINNLESQLKNNQNGVVRWITNLKEEDENARMNAKEFMDYASSVVLFDNATSSGSDYISRESARNMMEYAWRSMAGDIVDFTVRGSLRKKKTGKSNGIIVKVGC